MKETIIDIGKEVGHAAWNKLLLIFLLFLTIWLYRVIIPILFGYFPFTFDQGRDFLWVKNQVDFHTLSLIGPWGSLTGVYFGPLWFWFLTIPYLISDGSPIVLSLANAFLIVSTIILSFFIFFRQNKTFAFILVLIALFSTTLQAIAAYPFPQHLLPVFTLLLMYSYTRLLLNSSSKHLFFSVLIIGLMFHAEPPTAVLSLLTFPFILLFVPKAKKLISIKNLTICTTLFLITISPLILFDIRHQYIQLHSILDYIQGSNTSLGGVLPLWERPIERINKIIGIFSRNFLSDNLVLGMILFPAVAFFGRTINNAFLRNLWKASIFYLISLYLTFTLFPPELKDFYLDGLIIVFAILVAISLTNLIQHRLKTFVFFVIFSLFIVNLVIPATKVAPLINSDSRSSSEGTYYIQSKILDWIYNHADAKGFRVYTFTPAVYDYTYQYLFFQQGLGKYGYLPEDFSYLPQKPEYVQRKTEQLERLQDKIIKPSKWMFLIIMPGESTVNKIADWRKNLPISSYKFVNSIEFAEGTIVEKYINLNH